MSPLYQQIEETVRYLRTRVATRPEVGIILGTGLGGLAKEIVAETIIEYGDIPHFPLSTVESHQGKMIFGTLGGKTVVAMQGRFHSYEGYTMQQITFPVRVMKFLGVDTLLVSNAAGGMNPLFSRGDIMLIADHINLLGDNPLIGPNDDQLGPRFPDMSEPYCKVLISLAERIGVESRIHLQKGVFVAVPGPNLETRAEYRFLRGIGADVIGMSTVPEVIVAVHMSMRVLGFSIITDECFPDSLKPAKLDEIVATAMQAEPKLTTVMKEVIHQL
jgi:purine-nucleoside phosphorylase